MALYQRIYHSWDDMDIININLQDYNLCKGKLFTNSLQLGVTFPNFVSETNITLS